jgi:hypothetical protein
MRIDWCLLNFRTEEEQAGEPWAWSPLNEQAHFQHNWLPNRVLQTWLMYLDV